LRNLILVDGFKVVAVADTSEVSLQRVRAILEEDIPDQNVEIFSDFTKLIAHPAVDCIIVATPNFHHINVLRKAIPANKHILCEKPDQWSAGLAVGYRGSRLYNTCLHTHTDTSVNQLSELHAWVNQDVT